MTIAIAIKVSDGIVLAADSATTLPLGEKAQIYNNGNKIVNLHKALPVGVMTWGAGNIGLASMSAVFKDFRNDWMKEDPEPTTWNVEEIAERLRSYLYEDRAGEQPLAAGGTLVAGWSEGASSSCAYLLDNASKASSCVITETEPARAQWWGQPDPISRLLNGFSLEIADVMVNHFGVAQEDVPSAIQTLSSMRLNVIAPPMPIQDALDLAEFLAEMTKTIARFSLGEDQTVGGPVELAAITKHEAFKWAKRKHYYDRALNPDNVI